MLIVGTKWLAEVDWACLDSLMCCWALAKQLCSHACLQDDRLQLVEMLLALIRSMCYDI